MVLTIPSKQALAGVMHKIKQATKTGTSRTLGQVLRKINPILRGWAAYFRYGASKQTFSYLGWYAWWRMIYWIRRKHPHLTWKQIRRRYYGADRIREGKLVLYNPAKMRVERYRYRGAQIATPFNIDVVDPAGARFRRTGHDDVEFVGQVSELDHLTHPGHVESPVRGQPARRVRRAGTGKPTAETLHGVPSPTQQIQAHPQPGVLLPISAIRRSS